MIPSSSQFCPEFLSATQKSKVLQKVYTSFQLAYCPSTSTTRGEAYTVDHNTFILYKKKKRNNDTNGI